MSPRSGNDLVTTESYRLFGYCTARDERATLEQQCAQRSDQALKFSLAAPFQFV